MCFGSCNSLARGLVKSVHYLLALLGTAFLFLSIWALAVSGGSHFGMILLISSLITMFMGVFGVYIVGYRSTARVKIHSILFAIFILFQLSILITFISAFESIRNAMVKQSDSSDSLKANDFLNHNRWGIVTLGSILLAAEMITLLIQTQYTQNIAQNELEEMLGEDEITVRKKNRNNKNLESIGVEEPKQYKTDKHRAQLNEKYGNLFVKHSNDTRQQVPNSGGYRKM